MQIKHQALGAQVQKNLAPLYILSGSDQFLLDDAIATIKSRIKKSYDCDEQSLSIEKTEDWNMLIEEANSYSLFSDAVLITVYFEKKTIEAAAKKILIEYLSSINSRCFMIVRAPNLPAKQLLWLSSHELALVVLTYPLSNDAMIQWIGRQLKHHQLSFEAQVPALIQHYTQGNMLASAQVIEKLALSYEPDTQVTEQMALSQVSDQCQQSPFELVEACLMGKSDAALHIIRQSANNKTEATLILWMLAQEIRTLMQLQHQLKQNPDFRTAASQLKIWPQRISLYQSAAKRMDEQTLQKLLHHCKWIDEQIKTNSSASVWNAFECLAMSLCLGRLVGESCVA